MKTYNEIRQVVDNHEQKRQNSCSQSAVEMVLKLHEILQQGEYPEQALAHLDGVAGFAHYAGLGNKAYNGTTVSFKEEKFDVNLRQDWRKEAWKMGIELLGQDIYPIFSMQKPDGNYHCYMGIPDETDTMQFITKDTIGPGEAQIQGRKGYWRFQMKTEILIIKPV